MEKQRRLIWAEYLRDPYRAIREVVNRFEIAAGRPDDEAPIMNSQISAARYEVKRLDIMLAGLVKEAGDSTAPNDLRLPILDALDHREALTSWMKDDWYLGRPDPDVLDRLGALLTDLQKVDHWLRRPSDD